VVAPTSEPIAAASSSQALRAGATAQPSRTLRVAR